MNTTLILASALLDVSKGLVAYHPVDEPCGDRYGWRPDGVMTQSEDEALHLAHARSFIEERRLGRDVVVRLTDEGALWLGQRWTLLGGAS
jgi:hypothetical protein